jgi:hypothetical protein
VFSSLHSSAAVARGTTIAFVHRPTATSAGSDETTPPTLVERRSLLLVPACALPTSVASRGSVKGKTVGIQFFYGRRLIEHDTYYPTDTAMSASIAFSPAVVMPSASRLPFGRYTCRFLIDGKVIYARTETVGWRPAQGPRSLRASLR